jgi:aldehyde dehydrogenase (NAD+)
MKDCRQFFIDGKWVNPTKPHDFPVINPATEQTIATISLGTPHDVTLQELRVETFFPADEASELRWSTMVPHH